MNLNHRSSKALIVGASGTGKTTFLARLLLATPDCTQFIYDHQGDIATRLGLPPILDYDGLVKAVADAVPRIVFDPCELYPGDLRDGFNFFSDFAFSAASEYPGHKIFVSDEIQLVTDTDDLPLTFRAMLETGRRQELDLVLVSQQPNQCHNYIRNQATEIVVFNVALDGITKSFLASRGFDVEAIPLLPEGHYIARDVRRNLEKRGQLWAQKKVVDKLPRRDVASVNSQSAPPSEPEDGLK